MLAEPRIFTSGCVVPLAGGRDPFVTEGVNVSFFRCDVTYLTVIFRVCSVTSLICSVTSLILQLFFMFIV